MFLFSHLLVETPMTSLSSQLFLASHVLGIDSVLLSFTYLLQLLCHLLPDQPQKAKAPMVSHPGLPLSRLGLLQPVNKAAGPRAQGSHSLGCFNKAALLCCGSPWFQAPFLNLSQSLQLLGQRQSEQQSSLILHQIREYWLFPQRGILSQDQFSPGRLFGT